jgi:hypothetical protein
MHHQSSPRPEAPLPDPVESRSDRGIRSLVRSRRGAFEITIIGAVVGICVLTATMVAVFDRPGFLAGSPEKPSSPEGPTISRPLPLDLCSVIDEQRLATLVRNPVVKRSHEDTGGGSFRRCTAASSLESGPPRDYLGILAIRREGIGRARIARGFEQSCDELPRVPGSNGAIVVPVPEFPGLGERHCASASYNRTSKVADVDLVILRGTDLLLVTYSRQAPDGEQPLHDAVQLAKDILAKL